MSTHTEIFEHTDGDEDRIQVVHFEEGLSLLGRRLLIETRDVEGDQVQVVLGRDDALRLAKAITDALEPGLTVEQLGGAGMSTEERLTAADLESLLPGEKVLDEGGDVWTKLEDGRWKWQSLRRSSDRLAEHYGPITAVRA